MEEWKERLLNLVNSKIKFVEEKCCEHCSCQNESAAVKDTDAMGREKFWEDLGRP
jgi:hypothetical protein